MATFLHVGHRIFLLPCAGGGGRRIFLLEASKQILQREKSKWLMQRDRTRTQLF
jgi:glycerol-3-phosphate cytidylyltransferase-like family protein